MTQCCNRDHDNDGNCDKHPAKAPWRATSATPKYDWTAEPWSPIHGYDDDPGSPHVCHHILSMRDYNRAKECVNACAGVLDPSKALEAARLLAAACECQAAFDKFESCLTDESMNSMNAVLAKHGCTNGTKYGAFLEDLRTKALAAWGASQ